MANNSHIPSPPEEKKFSIRTMGSDVEDGGLTEAIRSQALEEQGQPPELIEPISRKPLQPTPPISEISETPEAQPSIPEWAKEKLEEETTQKPVVKKNIIFTLVIIAAIIGFILLGYFVAFNFLFKH